ncbi:ferrochelatase [Estrella lausannensis]|uniref:Ferrochelatase n=1 Tax=Estrella lausannensis TaxID=483423 RepID=A0A0H5DSZ8_9BACT|nr:ferrochelatase [Estrella lausannensis]CRX39473.1 Ferrochelatase [Estrella lausannensis]
MKGETTGVLLVNLGTPDTPAVADVRRYLHEFLLDPRVIDIPRWKRELLVRCLIVPKRVKNTAASYSKIWTGGGSPLLFWGKTVRDQLQAALSDSFKVVLAMRYQNPSIEQGLEQLAFCKKIIILPLFPQYASATTGSIFEKVMFYLKRWLTVPEVHFIPSYPVQKKMVACFSERAREKGYEKFDRILFSFHGLPIRQIRKCDRLGVCKSSPDCCVQAKNPQCYASQCVSTAHAVAKELNIPKEKFVVTFQSRLGSEPWLEPSTQDTVHQLAKNGVENLLVFSPSFVADCLETLYEIGVELKDEFTQLGGKRLELVPSLNDHPLWIEGLKELILAK